MSTPLSRRTRGQSKTGQDAIKSGSPSCSPAITPTSKSRPRSFLPTTPSAGVLQRPFDYDYDDFDPLMPSTQMFNSDREVFWNYEASPKTREALARKLAESDDEEEEEIKVKPKASTPAIKLKSNKVKVPSINDLHSDENFLSLKNVMDKMYNEKAEEKTTPAPSPSALNSPNLSNLSNLSNSPHLLNVSNSPHLLNVSTATDDDPFAKDDSFLVMCSQAIDDKLSKNASSSKSSSSKLDSNSNHKMRRSDGRKPIPIPPKFELSPEKLFDEDDAAEFEYLLSQIEIPSAPPSCTIVSKQVPILSKPTSVLSKPLPQITKQASNFSISATVVTKQVTINARIAQAPVSTVTSQLQSGSSAMSQPLNKVNTNLFKRFKSADDARLQQEQGKSSGSSPAVTKDSNFRRFNTVPETTPGPLPGGRQINPSIKPKCTKEEIERKRQEALQRRLNSQKLSQVKR